MAQNKNKKKRLNVKRLITLLLILYLLIFGIYKFFNEPIRNIKIYGNYLVSDADIITSAGIKNYPPLLSLNVSKIKKNIKKNSLITDVSVKRNLKRQVIIRVKELKVICLDRNNNKYLLEDNSSVDASELFLGIPTLINYTKEDVLKEFLKEMGTLDYNIITSINEIEYLPSTNANDEIVDETRFLLKMNDGNSVYINLNKLKNLKYYHKIYANLGDNKGILHLDSGEYMEVQ